MAKLGKTMRKRKMNRKKEKLRAKEGTKKKGKIYINIGDYNKYM